ncbi:GROU protein, partial [Acromyrmex insinuator]
MMPGLVICAGCVVARASVYASRSRVQVSTTRLVVRRSPIAPTRRADVYSTAAASAKPPSDFEPAAASSVVLFPLAAKGGGGSGGAAGGLKFTVADTCERIKEEFNFIQQQYHSLKLECEKLASEKTEMQRHYVMVRHFVSSFLCLSSFRSSLVTSFVSQVESEPNQEQLRQQFSSLIVKMSAILAAMLLSVR